MRERGTLDAAERTVPYDTDAEEAVLGALLLDPQAVNRVSTFLTAADFYRERNGWVYEAVLALADSARPVDVVTLGNELSRRDRLEAAGGLGYLSHLVSVVPTALHVEHYAEIVHRCALMRRLIAVGGQIAALGYQAGPDVDATLGRAEDMLYSLRREGAVRGFVHIREVLDQYLEESVLAEDEEKPELKAVKTGFVDIDRMLGGLQRSDLVILAARPSLGKSSLALNVAHHAALRQKATVAIFSLEMSAEQVAQRLLCSQAGVDSQRVRMGFQNLSRAEQDRINEAVGVLANTPIYIDDTPLIRVSELRAKAKRLHAEIGVDLVVVDYLQLIAGNTPDNRVQEISEISRSLKGLAREIDVPVLALSQLSRAVEGRTPHVPMLSDLRDSGCLPGDTLVCLPDEGVYRRMDQLVGQSDFNVLALNTETWQLEPCPMLRAFPTGHKPVIRLATRLGRSIRATANHQFLTIDGWRRLDELAVGVRIALPRRLPGPTQATIGPNPLAPFPEGKGDGVRSAVPPSLQGRGIQGVRSGWAGETPTRLAESAVYWDEIVSIDPDGEEDVYDLTVDGLHNFVANDVIVHNSIEQDADVVMFIYREDVYFNEEQWERQNTGRPYPKGIATIIVGKHRNGPTGQVSLIFFERTTKFADLQLNRE